MKISDSYTDANIIKTHIEKHYFWGKWLHHAITVYGNKINNDNVTYYHGLSAQFRFNSLRKDFNIPTSLTTDLTVAQYFAQMNGKNGIILQLQCQWSVDSEWNRSKAFSVEWISSHPGEKEILLFGNFNQCMIYNVMLTTNIKCIQSAAKIAAMNNFESLCNGRKSNGKYDNDNIMKMLFESELDSKYDDYYAQLFHNICVERQYFVIQMFIDYEPKTVFDVLSNDDDI
eukprot:379217_1